MKIVEIGYGFSTLFCCDLDLDLMTFIYELDPYSLEIYRMCKYKLSASRLESYRLTERQTDSQTRYYTTPLRRWSIITKVLNADVNPDFKIASLPKRRLSSRIIQVANIVIRKNNYRNYRSKDVRRCPVWWRQQKKLQ